MFVEPLFAFFAGTALLDFSPSYPINDSGYRLRYLFYAIP